MPETFDKKENMNIKPQFIPQTESVDDIFAEAAAGAASPAPAQAAPKAAPKKSPSIVPAPAPVVEEVQEPEEEGPFDPLAFIAENYKGAPSKQVLENWKSAFGAVYAFAPDDDSIFLLRPLRRLEHKAISADLRQLSQTARAQEDPSYVDDQLHEKVVTACCLYPQTGQTFFTMTEAGLVPTLFNLIMEHSKFLAPDVAKAATFKL